MTIRTGETSSELQPIDCVCYRLRRAARLAAKTYDRALKPIGLRNTQFALLSTLKQLGEANIGDLSKIMATDGTTLTRNLEVLVRRRLIENVAVDDARIRVIRITELGEKTHDKAMPLWRAAQEHALGAVGPKRWNEMRDDLGKIEQACA